MDGSELIRGRAMASWLQSWAAHNFCTDFMSLQNHCLMVHWFTSLPLDLVLVNDFNAFKSNKYCLLLNSTIARIFNSSTLKDAIIDNKDCHSGVQSLFRFSAL